MKYFIIRNIYTILEYDGMEYDSFHIVKAEDWKKAVDLVWRHRLFDSNAKPVRSELYGEGSKEDMRSIFFSGTRVYTEDKHGKLKVEEL